MPISIDRFEDDDALDEPTTSERIVRFLLDNTDLAYTRGEIADAIGAKPETVGTNLTRLKDRSLVRHREPYWALADERERAIDMESDEREADAERTDTAERKRAERGSSGTARPPSRPHAEAAAAFVERVRDRLEDDVNALYLFGSVARGAETAASDVDVLAVVADDVDFADVDEQLLDIAYNVQIEYEVSIEVHSMREGEFAARRADGDPLVRTVLEEGKRRV